MNQKSALSRRSSRQASPKNKASIWPSTVTIVYSQHSFGVTLNNARY